MIELMKDKMQAKVSDEEFNWLADTYLKLQKNKTYQMMSKTFQQFITDYLDDQLKDYMKAREKDGKK